MADIRTSSMGGVPKGTTADRPSNPSIGDVFYNGTLGCLDIYTAQGWVANSAPPAIPDMGSATYSATNQPYNNASASISFTPGQGGGLPNSYRATSTPGGFSGTATSSPITVSGLQNGTAYTFTVTGTNNFGTSAASISSNSITPITVPQAPTIGTASDLITNGAISLTFTAGATGGSSITNYKYSIDGVTYTSLSPAQTSSPLTISGLTNDVAVTIRLKAVNAQGDSIASSASNSVTPTYKVPVESLVVAGGGGGGGWVGAGGGAGGLVYTAQSKLSYSTQYNILVGAGGNRTSSYSGGYVAGTNGVNSSFNNLIALGGGLGGGYTNSTYANGVNGGSGGGGTELTNGSGSTPGLATQPSSASGGYGSNGGEGVAGAGAGAGGGGAGTAGTNSGVGGYAGNGGNGLNTWSTWATATSSGVNGYFAGGGGGGGDTTAGTGGAGGGGAGTKANDGVAGSGTSNTGGGGGGARNSGGPSANQGGAGGSGIVILRYPDTYPDPTSYPNGTKYTSGGYKYFKFTSNGSITF